MKEIKVLKNIFHGRKNISWDDVRWYMKKYQRKAFEVKEYGDIIKINLMSIDEYTSSAYTRRLKGTLAKTKANISQILPELIQNSTNRRWVDNKEEKHRNNKYKKRSE